MYFSNPFLSFFSLHFCPCYIWAALTHRTLWGRRRQFRPSHLHHSGLLQASCTTPTPTPHTLPPQLKKNIYTQMSKESSPKYRKWDKNQEGGVRQKERVKRGNIFINSRKLFHNTFLYTGYSSPHVPTQKLKYYKIQDYQCTAFHNNVQGSVSHCC